MNVARNGAQCIMVKHLKFIFVMGGSSNASHNSGSLDVIERYDLEFDKWMLLTLKMPLPIHDFMAMIMPTSDDD